MICCSYQAEIARNTALVLFQRLRMRRKVIHIPVKAVFLKNKRA
jgi:hypothetical protein